MKVHINLSESCTPDVHAVGCRDQARAKRRRGYAGTYEADAESLMDIACNYWSDFLNEWDNEPDTPSGEEQALQYLLGDEPKVYPCVHLPER